MAAEPADQHGRHGVVDLDRPCKAATLVRTYPLMLLSDSIVQDPTT
jgi:hypothetical protein